MSPDDIFAAQMWPWPDPVIKRDSAGRVLFINAAFLSLYGGRVESWTGQPVMGWPAPNQQGHPYRFETRAGIAPQETIYDWVEVMMADGHALAIARDVTAYQPPAQTQTAPQDETIPVAPPVAEFDSAHAAPGSTYAQADIATPPASMTPPPAARQPAREQAFEPEPPMQAALQIEPAPAAEAVRAPEPQNAQPQIAPEIQAPEVGDLQGLAKAQQDPAPQVEPLAGPAPAPQPAHIETPAPQAQTQFAPVEPPAPSPEPEPEPEPQPVAHQEAPKRDFERRALPIENDEAVLGSNWRDAVIARAVGSAAAPAEDVEAPAPAMPSPQVSKSEEPLRILLAEDNAINALLTRTLLEADGCVVETVEDGALAVEAVKNNEYDLILMDMRMPNMDGLEATRKIRAMGGERAEKWPIIALTANAFDDDRNACFDSGMNDFMTKPVSAEELSQMVETWALKSEEQRLAS